MGEWPRGFLDGSAQWAASGSLRDSSLYEGEEQEVAMDHEEEAESLLIGQAVTGLFRPLWGDGRAAVFHLQRRNALCN